jgi:kynureninase
LEFLIKEKCAGKIEIITPANSAERGCQLSLRAKKNGKGIHEFLNSHGVVCDWREPDVVRAAPVPLYNTFMDVWSFVEILSRAESFGS